jgi:retron-type reverse transcriptase
MYNFEATYNKILQAIHDLITFLKYRCKIMKKYGNLWHRLISFQNLYEAYKKAIKGRRIKENVADFIFIAEEELLRLHKELKNKIYRPRPYRTFYIYDKKRRLISSSSFRDRVVHHALCNVIEPIFEKTFIFDLYSNRKNKGVHEAVKRARAFAKHYAYVLKCDIKKYFSSIDHLALKKTIRSKIKCSDTLWMTDLIIDSSNPQEQILDYFPGDTLFTPAERRKGLPIGNQTSQFFANVYMSPLDHFTKECLKVKGYIRYVDDFLLFGEEKNQLWKRKKDIELFLTDYRLKLKPNGITLYRVENGFPFLGYRILPYAILIQKAAILRFRRKSRVMQKLKTEGKISLLEIKQSLFGAMGHFIQADSYHLRCKLLREACF